ncbi:hypothetical protein NQ314_004130 [Rhamnusium bicolor]|uniref:Nuclease HARBI1 n=1 Tax=Rhamnusium bicolor TaxID=1586634 RepID=A0AAV8ZLB3_9CUCU|nr:hypothetical protein NQ314_004130 [Rhamnusium bicolor]
MDYSSSSDSSDEELFDIFNVENGRNFRIRNDPFEEYSESEFRDRFRFTKDTVNYLAEIIRHDIEPTTLRNRSLSVAEQLLITLRFYATGSFQILIGDDLKVHKSTVCRDLKKVTYAIARLAPQFINMPVTDEEIRQVKSEFYNIRRFPNVLGCIDVATAVLHNISILRNDVEEFDEEFIDGDAEVNDVFVEENGGGNAVRRAVINYFR